MKSNIHRSNERGEANHGWLHAKFSFSFSNYYNPDRLGFGALKVLNDDTIQGGSGFGAHPHANMEIITIPTHGAVAHEDNTGTGDITKVGEVQVMSAGKGIIHSEFNNSEEEPLRLFQIWIEPHTKNVEPRYEKKSFELKKNEFTPLVSGEKDNEKTLFIYQDATLMIGEFDAESNQVYGVPKDKGIFLMVIEGEISIDNEVLEKRDSIEITKTESFTFKTKKDSKILLIEVPM